MLEAFAAIWLILGTGTAILAAVDAHRYGIRLAWGWLILFVMLGPIVPLSMLIAVLFGPSKDQ